MSAGVTVQDLHIDRRLVTAILAAWTSLAAGLLLASPGLVVAGVFIGALAWLGSAVPTRPRLTVTHDAGAQTPNEGDDFQVSADVTNHGRSVLAEWKLQLSEDAHVERGETCGFAVLPHNGRVALGAEVSIQLFGLHRIGPLRLRVGDPFGFVHIEEVAGEPFEMRVYPRRHTIKETNVRSRQQRPLQGLYEISQPGHGFEFYGLREYTYGDRPRDINWKASARADKYIVNQHERETNAEVVVLVDIRAQTMVGNRLESPYAQGCRAGLSLAEVHLNYRDQVRFMAYGEGTVEDRHSGTARQLQGILDILVGLEPTGNTPLLDVVQRILPHLRPRSPIYVMTSLVGDPSVKEALVILKTHDFPLAVFVPEPEWGEKPSQAAMSWQAQQDHALRTLRRSGIPALKISPSEPLENALKHMEILR